MSRRGLSRVSLIVALGMFGLAAGPSRMATAAVGGQLDPAFAREVVESVRAVVEEEYFDPAVAERAARLLTQGLAEGRYTRAQTLEGLAELLTGDLFGVSRDKHLVVEAVDRPGPQPDPNPSPPDESRERRGQRENFGVRRVDVLPGNIGYLHLTSFYRLGEAREAIVSAMRLLRHADALILDLRDNGGGSPDTVAFLASYFFDDAELLLFQIVPRPGAGETRSYFTQERSPTEGNGTRPVFVLTSTRTFSAGEGLAFILQERGRAEVVGEQTAGAANPGRPHTLNDRVRVTVPNGRVRSAVGGSNWEGVGVVPDVEVPAAHALDIATGGALGALVASAGESDWRRFLRRRLQVLEDSGGEMINDRRPRVRGRSVKEAVLRPRLAQT